MNRMRNILLQALLLVSLSAEAQRTLSLEEAPVEAVGDAGAIPTRTAEARRAQR